MLDESGRGLLRHLLATLAYRTQKALRGAPEGFLDFSPGAGVRSPREILAHMADVIRFATRALSDPPAASPDPARPGAEIFDFHDALGALSRRLDAAGLGDDVAHRILQGPFSDAMTHVGQLTLLRRLSGSPVPAESFFRAEIRTENTSPDRPEPAHPLLTQPPT